MATLEQTRDTVSTTTTAVDSLSRASTYAPSGAVPSPFPDQPRGRSSLADKGRQDSTTTTTTTSRSPNGTRRSLSKIGDRIKRAVSQARDSSVSSENQDRGRRGSEGPATSDEPRGRSPFSAFAPRTASASRGRQSIASTNVATTSQYPLSATQTRSSSRGRTALSPGAGKVVSSGRGGAGNLVAISNEDEVLGYNGEEDPDLVKQVRQDRSQSREREGRIEVSSSGRGGRGNVIRSQSGSRDLEVLEEQERAEKEDELMREEEYRKREERERANPSTQRWVSSGRGGAGNFSLWGSKAS
ncbi:uncharacterized protein JCM15063_000590 [Sporobolomyces koalae]|uniref:uncharacterized protein n=1 Tax=Sporobolomyces koalae TaxID=500713 RepID=UPI00316D15A8